MNTFLIILFLIIVLTILLLIFFVYLYNKLNESIIRIDEAESRIDNNLRDKYDLLTRCMALLKDKVELNSDVFKKFYKLKSQRISNFDLDRVLVSTYNEIINICNSNKKDIESEELFKARKQIEIIDEELITLREYYNGNITKYNKMIKSIPTNFIAMIYKYKEKMFYDLKNMKDENYDDFKL